MFLSQTKLSPTRLKMYEKSKYAALTDLTIAAFPNNYIGEGLANI